MEQYHYLTYEQPVGEHLKYLAWAQGRPIACIFPETPQPALGFRRALPLSDVGTINGHARLLPH